VHLNDQQTAGLQAESDVVLQEGLGGTGGPAVDPRRLLLFVPQTGVAEAGPALASGRGILGASSFRLLGRDREDDGVVHDRRVLRLELGSGEERRPGQLRIDHEAAVLVGTTVRRRRGVGLRDRQVEEPLAGPQRLRPMLRRLRPSLRGSAHRPSPAPRPTMPSPVRTLPERVSAVGLPVSS
jgi:hypothetical protein